MSVTEWASEERCVRIAEYLIENGATVRSAATVFHISKSTVHKDLTETLRRVNYGLFLEAEKVLQKNKRERHLRGGEATRMKYFRHRSPDVPNVRSGKV